MSGNTDFRIRVLVEGNADAAVQAIVPGLKQIEAAANKATAAVGDGSRRNLQVMQDMGRVIQDMPYGINGIANNIQPLIESFNRSRDAAGGTSGAIAGILSGLASPTGLAMVGIPVVTSLAVAFGGKLVEAVSAGSESVDKLKERLAGIQQYQEFDLTIRIAGLKGLDLVEAKLNQLIRKRQFMENSVAIDEAVKKSTPSVLSRMIGGALYGQYYTPGSEYYQSRKNKKEFNVSTAQQIAAGEMTLGAEEDTRYLTTYLKKSPADAQIILARSKSNFELNLAAAQYNNEVNKGNKSSGSGSGGRSSVASVKDDSAAWARLIEDGNRALNKIGETALPSIEAATAAVTEKTKAYYDAVGSHKLQEATGALKSLNEAEAVKLKATAEWEAADKRAGILLAKGADSAISYTVAHQGVADAESALAGIRQMKGLVSADFLVDAENKLVEARIVEGKSIDALRKKSEQLSKVFKGVGDMAALFGLNGQGVTGLLEGVSGLSAKSIQERATKENVSTAQAAAEVYAGIGQSLGAVVGGKVGAGISNVASGALAGFTAAGPIGAAVGGAIGLIGSIFGGGSSGPTQGQSSALSASQSNAQAVGTLANSGSATAQAIMRRAGYSDTNLAGDVYGHGVATSAFYGIGIDSYLKSNIQNLSLFYTKENNYNQSLLDYIDAMDKVDKAVKSFASTSIVTKIAEINWKYEELIGLNTTLAGAEQARMAELIVSVTGITADSIGQLISAAVNADTNGSAGKAFADKFEESIASAIKNMAISNLVNSAIMPVLQPVMASLVGGLMAGTLSTSGMASMFAGVKVVADQLAPVVSALSQSFIDAGLGGTSASMSSVSSSGYNSLAAYRMAQAGIPAFADGGAFIAGEAGPEIVRISAGTGARIYNTSDTRSMLDNSQVVVELKALREETRAGQYAIAKSCARSAQWIEKWEKDGLPATTTL